MSTFGMFLIFAGVLIIISRSPFIVAPEATRSLYMRILDNDARMRGWDVFAVVIGALAILATQSVSGPAAEFTFWFGVFIIVLGFGSLIAFPATMRNMAQKIWRSFSPPVLRVIGVLSVGVGAVLIYYGLQF